jgi:hypothetical protein
LPVSLYVNLTQSSECFSFNHGMARIYKYILLLQS